MDVSSALIFIEEFEDRLGFILDPSLRRHGLQGRDSLAASGQAGWSRGTPQRRFPRLPFVGSPSRQRQSRLAVPSAFVGQEEAGVISVPVKNLVRHGVRGDQKRGVAGAGLAPVSFVRALRRGTHGRRARHGPGHH